MVLRININKATVYLFYGLLFFSTIGYLGYYYYALSNEINVYNNYLSLSIDDSVTFAFSLLIKHLKEILLIILFIIYLFSKKNDINVKMVCFFLLMGYGTLTALFLGFHISILGGIRGYLYFLILYIFLGEMKSYNISIDIVKKIIYIGLCINFLVAAEQAFSGTDGLVSNIGKGDYRFMGLFGGWGPCSAFAVAACLFFYVYSTYFRFSKAHIGIVFTLSFLLECICGSRSGLICIIVIIFVWLFRRLPLKKNKNIALFSILSILTIWIIKFVEGLASRGSIVAVQLESGRIMIFQKVVDVLSQNVFTFIFGKGLGAGSNTSVLMMQLDESISSSIILDGTFNTILYQWGMIGVLLLVVFMLALYIKLTNVQFDVKLLFWVVLFVEGITSNLFENFACQIVLFITYALMCKRQVFIVDTNSKVIS